MACLRNNPTVVTVLVAQVLLFLIVLVLVLMLVLTLAEHSSNARLQSWHTGRLAFSGPAGIMGALHHYCGHMRT